MFKTQKEYEDKFNEIYLEVPKISAFSQEHGHAHVIFPSSLQNKMLEKAEKSGGYRRPIKKDRASNYADMLANDEWQERASNPICLDSDLIIRNGNNRFEGFSGTGKTYSCLVQFDMSDKEMAHVDTGAKRNMSDSTHFMSLPAELEGFNIKTLAATANVFAKAYGLQSGYQQKEYAARIIPKIYQDYSTSIAWALNNLPNEKAASVLAAYARMYQYLNTNPKTNAKELEVLEELAFAHVNYKNIMELKLTINPQYLHACYIKSRRPSNGMNKQKAMFDEAMKMISLTLGFKKGFMPMLTEDEVKSFNL